MTPETQDKITGFFLTLIVVGMFFLRATTSIKRDRGLLTEKNKKIKFGYFLVTWDMIVSILVIIIGVIAVILAIRSIY